MKSDELDRKELFKELRYAFYDSIEHAKKDGVLPEYIEKRNQAYKQIVAILEHKVSEEWIEEKAGELFRLCNFAISLEEAESFIRSLVEEMRK